MWNKLILCTLLIFCFGCSEIKKEGDDLDAKKEIPFVCEELSMDFNEESIIELNSIVDSLDVVMANIIAEYYENKNIEENIKNRTIISLNSEVLIRSVLKFEQAVSEGGIADDKAHEDIVIWTNNYVTTLKEVVEFDSCTNLIIGNISYPLITELSKSKYLKSCLKLKLNILQIQVKALEINLNKAQAKVIN